jgi:hypothetical protein
VWPSTESPSRTSANVLGGEFTLQVVLVVQASFGFETVGGDLQRGNCLKGRGTMCDHCRQRRRERQEVGKELTLRVPVGSGLKNMYRSTC